MHHADLSTLMLSSGTMFDGLLAQNLKEGGKMKLNKLMAAFFAGAISIATVPMSAYAETPDDTLIVADAIDDVITLDPHEVGEIGGVLTVNQVYQTLVTYDVNDPSKISGVLAKDWSVSEDGKTFTFTMNRDAKFSSGNPVTAKDAEYSLRRIVKMNSRSAFIITQFGFTPENVDERVKATDEDTLVVTLEEAYAPSFFLYCLSSYVGGIVDSKLVQEHVTEDDFGNAWLKADNSAGSGPYVLGQWKPKESISLQRNENFWGEQPAMNRIVLRHIAESSTQRLLLEKGDIDIANKLSPDAHEALAGNDDIKKLSGLSGTIYYMGLNARHELLGNQDFRQAMKYLVDYQGIAEAISRGTMEVHQTMIPRGFLGATDYNPYSYDLNKAKELLAKAGVDGSVDLNMVVWNTPPYTDFAQAIQAGMSAAGINLDLQVVDGKQWLTRYRNSDLDIWLGLWGPDYPDPHSNAKAFAVNEDDAPDGSSGLADRFGWDSGDLSPRTMNAVRERDIETRKQMYTDIQKEHTDSSPFIYMFQELRAVGVRSNVEGVILGTTFADDRYWKVTK
jgi:peptide/nickel transport system substrate-binding protein